jgi:hypothetical protein
MDSIINGRRRLAEGYIIAADNIHSELKGKVMNLDYHFIVLCLRFIVLCCTTV